MHAIRLNITRRYAAYLLREERFILRCQYYAGI